MDPSTRDWRDALLWTLCARLCRHVTAKQMSLNVPSVHIEFIQFSPPIALVRAPLSRPRFSSLPSLPPSLSG